MTKRQDRDAIYVKDVRALNDEEAHRASGPSFCRSRPKHISSTAVVPERISLIAVPAAVAVITVIPVALVVVAVTVIAVPYWNDRTASEQGGEDPKNENAFHIGSWFENVDWMRARLTGFERCAENQQTRTSRYFISEV